MNVEEILGEDTYTVIFRLMQFCDYIMNKDLNDEDEEVHFLADVAERYNRRMADWISEELKK